MASTIKALTATGSAIYFTPRHLAVLLFCLHAEQLITDDDGDRGAIARIIRDRFEDTPAAIQALHGRARAAGRRNPAGPSARKSGGELGAGLATGDCENNKRLKEKES